MMNSIRHSAEEVILNDLDLRVTLPTVEQQQEIIAEAEEKNPPLFLFLRRTSTPF